MLFQNKWANVAMVLVVAIVAAVIVSKYTKVVKADGTDSGTMLKVF